MASPVWGKFAPGDFLSILVGCDAPKCFRGTPWDVLSRLQAVEIDWNRQCHHEDLCTHQSLTSQLSCFSPTGSMATHWVIDSASKHNTHHFLSWFQLICFTDSIMISTLSLHRLSHSLRVSISGRDHFMVLLCILIIFCSFRAFPVDIEAFWGNLLRI